MKVDIKYGKDGVQKIDIPDKNYIGTFFPKDVQCRDPDEVINESIDAPIGYDSLAKFLEGGKDIVFIVNDGTRPTPTAKVLDALSKRMDLRKARYLIATGTHRDMTQEEYNFVFGKHYASLKDRIISHDAKKSECVNLGRSKNGTPMEVNKIAVDADRLVIITSVEPHYFAGYTGGRKSFLPGVASYRTVETNHKLAMRKEAQSLVLKGNPVHEDMMDALEVVKGKKIFSIQMVLDRHQHIYKVASGSLNPAFDKAVEWANKVFSVPIPEKADVVISVAPYPMDVDLYQSQKALDNGKWALKEGGKIVMVSKCREGVGHPTFLTQLSSSKDPKIVLENLSKEYKLGYHKAAKMAEIAVWADIWAVTDLDPKMIEAANIKPFPTVEAAVREALRLNPNAKFIVLADGSVTIPKVEDKMSDFKAEQIKEVKEALNTCTMCGFCKAVCPSFKAIGWDSALSRGRIILTYGLLVGDIEPDASVMENIYTCTTCADCNRRCPSNVDIVEIIETCRRDLVANGHILPKHKSVTESVKKYNNPYSEKRSVAETLGEKPHKAKVGYFSGCTATYREKEISKATLSILKKLKVDYTTVNEVCCGSVLQRIGIDENEVYRLMNKNIEAIKALGIETLVFSCSGCYRMFKQEYPKHVKVPFEVLHMSEFLAKQDLKLKSLGDVKITYHDPCHLGRHCGIYEPPRDVLKKFPNVNFKEMKYSKAGSHCCGGGGGVRSAFPAESKTIASTRLDEADFANIIVTTCPFCVGNLSAAVGDRKLKVIDLVELVDKNL
ncbi:CoB--CoM heterodisulfide reductase iron-sulfur subunit D [Candidatus Methanoplasma termitum]|uniref:HdrD1 protein n=1 Tax=Candidatus Methanoplasma termitum TaxID=1577791 RepID=A0A0A7LA29_9ARCH|nr:nickel-dependent lactate racemase [Candidatus Methanoplasma termitum]AIZ55939.1 CoB--CoM heterodisulfide reductase iron-sulfur subunit D [Candidatus Methanoplasma termitum]MCL2334257.1 nickel-dependent lactate racemase [Candidatus Methanoplasma sp.]